MKIIAYVRSDFTAKFGIPRQSGLIPQLESEIVFTPEFSTPEAFRGLDEYSHLWVLWSFHQSEREHWSPTVRPPRLGGNTRVGVFATRSPFRPNPIGLSCVRLLDIRFESGIAILRIGGADMMDGTPVYDIKPYIPYVDIRPEATGGFTDYTEKRTVRVEIPEALRSLLPADKLRALEGILAEDPRPAYQEDPERVYGFPFAGKEVRFRVTEGTLTVLEIL